MEDDLFTEVTTTTDTTDDNHLAALVGEGKKFKDVNELAKGKAEADKYIAGLTSKLDELKKELESRQSMQEYLDQIKAATKEPKTPAVTPDPQTTQVQTDDSDLERRVEELLARKEQARAIETAKERVNRVLQENFQDNAKTAINTKAAQLNMSVKDLQELAYKSPSAFFNLMGIQENVQSNPAGVVAPRSNVNTAGSVPSVSQVRGKSYYEKLKRENPTVYFDGKTTVQQIRDMQALGKEKYNNS